MLVKSLPRFQNFDINEQIKNLTEKNMSGDKLIMNGI